MNVTELKNALAHVADPDNTPVVINNQQGILDNASAGIELGVLESGCEGGSFCEEPIGTQFFAIYVD